MYRLYKEFGWVALFSSESDAARHLGKPITDQPESVLRKFFDPELTRLLLAEASCIAKSKGELCRLEFDPLFGSQDPAATELTIKPIGDGRFKVQYTYPSNSKKIELEYKLVRSDAGWRVSDIVYIAYGRVSLKSILSKSR